MTEEEPPEAGEPTPAPTGVTRQDLFSLLGSLGAITAILASVMFYFGWRRSDVQARAMGIDVSLFGFSSQDYVLRSISALYLPLLVVFGLALAWSSIHSVVVRYVTTDLADDDERRRRAATITRRVAIGATAVAVLGVLFAIAAGFESPWWPVDPIRDALQDDQWVVPCVLVIATLVAAYAWWLDGQLAPRAASRPKAVWQRILPPILVVGTVALGSFWMLEEYATAVGRGLARDLAATVERLPRAEVTSSAPLGIRADGVDAESIPTGDESVRYRTSGLRLLARSGGKVLLLHDGWNLRSGSVIVLPDSDDFTWQFSR